MRARSSGLGTVVLLSLEPWNDVWRRNQYLVASMLDQELVRQVVWVDPLDGDSAKARPRPNVDVVTVARRIPNRMGGVRLRGLELRRKLPPHDILWVNDPTLGAATLNGSTPVLYDVTDDWRSYPFSTRVRRRIITAEDRLARRAATVACSQELVERWQLRYNVVPALVQNAIDTQIWSAARPRELAGSGPHIGYVGTLQPERLDVSLIVELARNERVGTVHLLGPDALDAASRQLLDAEPNVRLEPPVGKTEVASWTKSFDVLVAPHLVNPFTLSLDAIKAHEYLASGRPVVATPTSGFQRLQAPQLIVVGRGGLVAAILRSLDAPLSPVISQDGWDKRARAFVEALNLAVCKQVSA